MSIIVIIAIIWFACKIIKHERNAFCVKQREKTIEEMLEDWHRQQMEEREEQIALLDAEAQRKTDKKRSDLEFKLAQAEQDIDYYRAQIEELNKYGERLELERDACAYGSTNYYKAASKVRTNDNKVHAAVARLNKAMHIKEAASRELVA